MLVKTEYDSLGCVHKRKRAYRRCPRFGFKFEIERNLPTRAHRPQQPPSPPGVRESPLSTDHKTKNSSSSLFDPWRTPTSDRILPSSKTLPFSRVSSAPLLSVSSLSFVAMSFSSRRSGSRTRPVEGNENDHGNPVDPVHLPPPRSPLISIQDPSQNSREGSSSELRLADFPIKGSGATPRSAPSTPARGLSRVCSGIGSSGANNAGHQLAGRERGFSSRVSTGIPDVKHLVPVDVPHFELNEDPSFWKDHNVQVRHLSATPEDMFWRSFLYLH